jgi:hypothetical protein
MGVLEYGSGVYSFNFENTFSYPKLVSYPFYIFIDFINNFFTPILPYSHTPILK